MSTSKFLDKICIIVIIVAMLGTILFMNGEALGLTIVVDEDAESYTGDTLFTANDLNGDWDTSGATEITLNGDDAHISGNGAYVYDGSVYISNGGTFVVSGTLTNGSLVIDAYDSSKIWILLDGVNIHRDDSAGILVSQADKVFLTLAAGSENVVVTGDAYSETAEADNVNGAIWSEDDLTINGSGSLTVSTGYHHGIKVKEDFVVAGGELSVAAPSDAIHCNEDFYFTTASLTINADDDAIHADDEIVVTGGTILIESCYEGFEALTIDVQGGDITVYPSDDGFNANGGSDGFGMGGFGGGGMGGGFQGHGHNAESTESDTEQGSMSEMDEAGNTEASDGERGEMPTMDGTEYDLLQMNDTEHEMPAMAESSNAESDSSEEEETWIHISGGTITIVNDSAQDADGLDSNGDILISGGDIRISLVGTGSNSAIDYGSESGGVCEITGGTVVACGASSMAESFDTTSTQCAILYNFSGGADAGTTVALEDSDGNVLISYDPPCSYNSVNLSCPELTLGETYLVVIGDDVEEVTLEETSASYGDTASGGFGGTMNWGGGMQSRENFNQENGGRGGHGGFGGRGRHGQSGDTESTEENTEFGSPADMPEPPEMGTEFDGEMPNFSEMGTEFDGEMPNFGEMGTEFDGERMMPPEMSSESGEMNGFGGMGGHGDGNGFTDASATSSETAAATTGTALSDLDPEIWIALIACAIVLLGGILVGALYRRY